MDKSTAASGPQPWNPEEDCDQWFALPAATGAELLQEAKDRVARIAVATHDRPAIERLAREALELLHRVTDERSKT